MLSRESYARLHEAGWFEGRVVDTQKYEVMYAEKGYPLNHNVLAFLREYGDLAFHYPNWRKRTSLEHGDFHAVGACCGERWWLRDFEYHLGQIVFPIGHASGHHELLVMGENGEVYTICENLLCKIGGDYQEAIDTLCEGRQQDCVEVSEHTEELTEADRLAAARRLADEGWFVGRDVDISAIEKRITQRGYGTSAASKRFLREFSGLRVTTETGAELDVDAMKAITLLDLDEVQEHLRRLPAAFITPVALLLPPESVVYMDDAGRMFGALAGVPDWILKFGDNSDDGIVVILSGKGASRV